MRAARANVLRAQNSRKTRVGLAQVFRESACVMKRLLRLSSITTRCAQACAAISRSDCGRDAFPERSGILATQTIQETRI
ncbi:MAG TPA: hypothetical protein VIR81_09695 [Myxococcales bacterium]